MRGTFFLFPVAVLPLANAFTSRSGAFIIANEVKQSGDRMD